MARRAYAKNRSIVLDGMVLEPCFYCRQPLKRDEITIDHVIPRAAGGTDRPWNLRPCCQRCNGCKGKLSAREFVTGIGKKLVADCKRTLKAIEDIERRFARLQRRPGA